jgi:hypothetical protein
MTDLNTALDNLKKQIEANGNGTTFKREKFVFPAGHAFILVADDMNALMDVCRTLYDHNDRAAPRMYAILRNATSAKL